MSDEDIELPPLPKASKMYDIPGYDEEELKDYARTAIQADRARRALMAESDALAAALEAAREDAERYRRAHARIAELEDQVQRAAEIERAAILRRVKNRAVAGALLVEDVRSIIDDRGPAPQAVQDGDMAIAEGSLPLRDWFAGLAMQGLLAAQIHGFNDRPANGPFASMAYEMADAMLKAREGER